MFKRKYSREQIARAELELRKRQRERLINAKPFNVLELTKATHPNYQAGWFHELLCKKLEEFLKKVENKESPRLIVNCPPRHGKSTLVSEKFPVRILAAHPNWNVIVASYSSILAERFSRLARDTIRDNFIRQNAPYLALSKDKQGVHEWETTQRGGYKAVGILGSITGSGAQIFIVDDPIKDYVEAYSETIRNKIYETYRSVVETRLAPGGGILLTQTRWHEDDLTGRLLRDEPERWEVFSYPAIAEREEEFRAIGEALHPERYNKEQLERFKSGTWVWNALYQQRPVAAEGNTIKRFWWRFYDELPRIQDFEELIFSWDMSFKGLDANQKAKKEKKEPDFVVGQLWGKLKGDAYLIDQVRGQWDFNNTLTAFKAFTNKYPHCKTALIEEKANGAAIISMVKLSMPSIALIPVNPEGSKEARAAAVSPKIEAGNAILPKYAGFVEGFINECASFPLGEHDDQVDSMSQALIRLFGRPAFIGVIDY